MRTCNSCGQQNADDRDFCDCGEYLRWEPTGFMSAIDASQVAASAPPVDPAPAPPPAGPPDPPPAAGAAPPPPPAAAPPAPAARPAPAAAAPPPPAPPAPPAPPDAGGNDGPSLPAPTARRATPPTAVQAAVPAPPVPAAPAAPSEPDLASISLRIPDVEGTPGGTVAVACDAGGRVRVLALVRNASGIVDNYRLELAGLPAEWYTIAPNPVYLVPFGTAGSYEQEVDIHLHPPRAPEAEARLWELQVVAHSAAHTRVAARAPLVLGIQPYEDFEPRLKPEKASGRRKASYDVTVRNKANAPVGVTLGITDAEDALKADFRTREIEVPAGESKTTSFDVRPPRQIYIGRPVEHRFEVLAKTGEEADEMLAAEAEPVVDGEGRGGLVKGVAGKLGLKGPQVQVGPGGVRAQGPKAAVRKPTVPSKSFGLDSLKPSGAAAAAPAWTAPLLPTQAVFRQKPWIPRWVLGLLLLLLLALLLLYLLFFRTSQATVPDVVGKTVVDATTAIERAELNVNPKIESQVSTKAKPGTIVRQTLPPGREVDKGRSITLVQAVGSDNVKVPDLVGKELGAASSVLDKARLTVGTTSPAATSPDVKVKSTIPAAGEVVKEGKAVQIFLVVPKAGGGKDGEEGGKDGEEGGKDGGAATVALPPIAGKSPEEAGAALAEAGVSVAVVKQFTDRAPAGEVFDQKPPAGEEVPAGQTVKLFVSLGIPRVAYDTDEKVILANGITGKGKPISKSPERQIQPSFNSTGSALLYVSSGQIKLKRLDKPDELPVDVTKEDEWRLPTFAPTPERNVVAALKLGEAHPTLGRLGSLCIGRLTKEPFSPGCLKKPEDVAGFASSTLRWAPDGKAIFVLGVFEDGRKGIFRSRSSKAFSPDADDWSQGRLMTPADDAAKFVLDLAISPDGKRMAMTSNLKSDSVELYLAKPGDFELEEAESTGVQACTASWRQDSKALVIVRGSCIGPGEVARVEISSPRDSDALASFGDAPVFQPATPE